MGVRWVICNLYIWMTEGSSWASQKSRRGLKKKRRKERTLDVYGHDDAGRQARSAEAEELSSDLAGAQKEIFAVCVWSFCLWHWKAPLMDETREAERRLVCRRGGREGGEEELCEIYFALLQSFDHRIIYLRASLSEGRMYVAFEKCFMYSSPGDILQKSHSGWKHLISQQVLF